MPCVYGLGAQAMLTNAPHIIRIFDTWAPVCLVGPSGRGKTLTMKMAQALFVSCLCQYMSVSG